MSEPMSPRELYRRDDLVRLLDPSSVAVVGASPRPGSFGQRVVANLATFEGELFLVNGRHDEIDGRPCFDSVTALPRVPDCVIVAVAREHVEAVLRECAERGVGGAIVYAAGYGEVGTEEGAEQQRRMTELARETGLRILGPNTIGPCNFVSQALLSFGPLPQESRPRSPGVGIVSQSGAIGQGLLQSIDHGTAITHALTSGNSADVDVADLVSYLADDPSCRAIACAYEGLADPSRIIEAARICARADTPLIIYKMAVGESGAAAAMSHTGSLSGSQEIFEAATRQAGAVLVERLETLVETASFFAKAPKEMAPGLAVVSTSGGGAVIAADQAEMHGVDLPQPAEPARLVLEQNIPEFGSAKNPCDITAQVLNDPDSLHACMEALMSDEAFGAVLYPHPMAYDGATPRLALLGEVAAAHDKLAAVVWMNESLEGPGAREAEANEQLALFRSMDSCMHALAEHQRTSLLRARSVTTARTSDVRAGEAARSALAQATGPTLGEGPSKEVLAAYGVPVVPEVLSRDLATARESAHSMGYPVVLKVESAQLPHKTEAGVVALDVGSDEELADAWERIMGRAVAAVGAEAVSGVLVQRMVPAGLEMIVGGRIDPGFGAVVVVGFGGVLVELLADSSVALAPVDHAQARSLIDSLEHDALLDGYRGAPGVDRDALADVVVRVSELIADHPHALAEVDVNPVICSGPDVLAVDGLLVPAAPTASRGLTDAL